MRQPSIASKIDEAMNGLLSSPGHVRNILDPHHRKVNIGVAYHIPTCGWSSYSSVTTSITTLNRT